MESLEDLQKRKLALEIAEIGQPYLKRPTLWLSIASALVAVIGVIGQNYLSGIKTESAKLEAAKAEKKSERAMLETAKAEKKKRTLIRRAILFRRR